MTRVDQSIPKGCAPVLGEGEVVLWQGRPRRRIRVVRRFVPASIAGAMVLFFTLFWTGAGADLVVTFRPLLLAVGLYALVGPHLAEMIRRRRSCYTLTNRAAYIGTDLFGRSLAGYPITPETRIRTRPGFIYFASRMVEADDETHEKLIGFELIEDFDKVLDLIRGVQAKAE